MVSPNFINITIYELGKVSKYKVLCVVGLFSPYVGLMPLYVVFFFNLMGSCFLCGVFYPPFGREGFFWLAPPPNYKDFACSRACCLQFYGPRLHT